MGVGLTAGQAGAGLTVSASGNQSKGRENGSSLTNTETTIAAGRDARFSSGQDLILDGAQASGRSVTADVGRNLWISSRQDSDRYDMKQTGSSAGISGTWGAGAGVSGSVSASRDKMNSNFDSVKEQSGIFAGSGGFDIKVGNHTQLDGGVLASTAPAASNRLETGTLGWTDIKNRADYEVEHQSAGLSTGGSLGDNFLGNLASNTLAGMNGSGHADSTTRAAVEAGTITVRDGANQQQDVSQLSRDTAHAANGLSPIFDKEKEQRRLEASQLIAEIGTQVGDIARTEGKIAATKEANRRMGEATEAERAQAKADWEKAHPDKAITDKDIDGQLYENLYNDAFSKTGLGTGGPVQRAIQAATAAVQGLAGGDINAALAGGAAPYIANIIAKSSDDPAVRTMAHAAVNAALSKAQGNNALAGAAGAATAEMMAPVIIGELGWDKEHLSEEQKQVVSALSTLAAGLAGGVAGDGTSSAVSGAQAGKTTVENNFLSASKNDALNKALEDQKNGKNLLQASQDIVRLTNEDKASNGLLDKYQKGQLNDAEKQQLAGLLNQYGYELQSVYGYSEQQAAEAIQTLAKGGAFVASAADAKAYNEALSYLKMYGAQSGQAAVGTDALMVLPGAPGALVRGVIAAGGSYQTGTGIGQIADGNYGDGALNVGLGTVAIFGSVAGQGSVSKPGGTIVTPGDNSVWQSSTIGNYFTKNEGVLSGRVTSIDPKMTQDNIRSLNRENESAKILSQSGFNVEQNPYVPGRKDPDYRINGEIFDNYAPKTSSVRNIWSGVKEKIDSGQTTNVVINMSDTKVSIPSLQQQLNNWPIIGLDKVIVIDKSGNPVRIK